jgi:adenylate cyclase 1
MSGPFNVSVCSLVRLQYQRDADSSFGSSLACSLVLLVFLGGVQLAVLPRTLILLLLFLTAFVWTAVLLMMLLAARLRWLRWDVTHAFAFRLAITVFTIVLLCAVAQVNVVRRSFILIHNLSFLAACVFSS